MKGTMTIIKTDGSTEKKEYDGVCETLDDLNAAVGGWIELIPYFNWYEGKSCVAYCNEEGKNDGLPINVKAHAAWEEAFGKRIASDHLVGNVAIVQGDDEFMEGQ